MAIILPSGFVITNNEPVDSRLSVADSASRFSLSVNNVYEGITVYERDTNIIYVLTDATAPSSASSWVALITNTSSSIATSASFATTASYALSGTGTFSGSFSGSFQGNGSGLTNIPASGIVGLNLSQIASGSVTASIAPNTGLQVNTSTTITSGSLFVTGTGSAGVVSNFGIAPLTSSFTVWDSQYYASSSQLNFLGPYSTNTVLATLVNKKPFGSVTDDDYTQFANYLELSYTGSDADRINLYRGVIDINLSSSYTQSADITSTWNSIVQRGRGYNSFGTTNTYLVTTVSESSYNAAMNGLWIQNTINSSSVGSQFGVRTGMATSNSSSINSAYAFYGLTQAGTWSRINNAYGLYLDSVMNTNASMSNYAGVIVTARATGSVSNALILLGTGSIPAGNWSIYNSSSYQNYLRGWVGINKEIPSTNLDIIGDVYVTGSIQVTAGATGSFSGSFAGDGSQLTNIPASGIVGLNLSQISSGSVSASISPNSGLQINTNVTATSYTGSLFGTASYAAQALSSSYAETASYVQNAVSASYAATASVAPAYLPLTGGTITGNLTVIGTSSFVYTTSSIVNVGNNTVLVNTNYPAVRFGGISVVDSGSFGYDSTGSLLWDSLNNRWVYSNPSGSTYDGGILIAGPKNTSGLGNESGMTEHFVAVGQGTDHIQPGTIFNSGSITQVTGSLTVTGGVTGSFTGSYVGSGDGLYNIPASGIVGLNLSQISSGSVSASISPNLGLQINTNVTAVSFTGSFSGSGAGLSGIFPVTTNAQILISTGSVLAARSVTGDINITNSGVTTIQPGVVTFSKIQSLSQAALIGATGSSGGTVQEIPIIEAYVPTGSAFTALLENTANWDINGDYIGSTITGTYQGQSHYNSAYWFTAIADNVWIRLIRG